MPRSIVVEEQIHPAIRAKVANNESEIMQAAKTAVSTHDVVVFGMAGNPFCKKACKALKAANIEFHYIEHGSYLKEWRRRNAIKMWTGWATFPIIFVKGQFIGGFTDLQKLITSGELKTLLEAAE